MSANGEKHAGGFRPARFVKPRRCQTIDVAGLQNPKLVAPGRNMVWEKWHGFIEIDDEVWSVNDYAFYIENPPGLKGLQGSMTISRSSGTLTVDTPRASDGRPLQRIGSCRRVTKEDRRF